MTTKESLHRLVDAIPDSGLDAAERVLTPLADPMLLALTYAPLDDEPITDEDRDAINDAREEHRRGETIGHAEALREPGG
jgi:hypothetical protein